MLRFLAVLFFVVAACNGSPVAPRILGGHDADIVDFPYIVSIERVFTGHYCGGVIISPEWVMTDAWCTSEPAFIEDFTIRVGSALLENGTAHTPVQWIFHPQNDVFNGEYDFALIQVDPPFEFSETVAAVDLPDQEQGTPNDADALISGWGRIISSSEQTHFTLQYAQVKSFGEAECSEALGAEFQNSKLCAQDPIGQIAHCYRDEGGPLVIAGTLYGIMQYPGTCAETFEVLRFSRVAAVRTWIDETIGA